MSERDRPPRFTVDVAIQWGDVDRMQHVNNVVFFRWMETARTRYFETIDLERHVPKGAYPILASIRCDYRAQLRYPDVVVVSCTTTRLGRSSVGHVYRVRSHATDVVVAEGEGTWVLFDYEAQRTMPLPDALVSAIEAFEGATIPRKT